MYTHIETRMEKNDFKRRDEEGSEESEEGKGKSDIKRRRQLPGISEEAWSGVNTIRKEKEMTWNEFFERINNYQDWLGLLLLLPRRPSLGDKLNAVTVTHYMPMWLQNIYRNFLKKHVKNIKDIKEIFDTATNKPAIVIGAGPSLQKFHHLELLADSAFYKEKIGPILTTSHTVKDCLEAGVIPDYMILLDPEPVMLPHIDHDIVDEYADKIKGIFPITIDNIVLNRWKGKKIFFLAAISEATIPNVQAVLSGLFPKITEMNALANAGTFSWNVAKFLGCNPIAMIGMDQGFLMDTPVEETPYYKAFQKSYDNREEILDNDYYFHTHSFFKTDRYTDDIYRNFAKNAIAAANVAKKDKGIRTINATGGGFIDKPEVIENMWFEDFLRKWEKKREKNE